MRNDPTLASIQRAFYDLVTTGEGSMGPGLLAGSGQLRVYADMYIDRLHDVVADDFPKLRVVLGPEAFRDLVVQFIRERPPTSFTIRDFGAALSEYLTTRDDVPAWSADLAALERARADVFDGPDAAAFSRSDLSAVPAEQFPELELQLVPASVLVSVTWTVDELWSAVEEETAHELPQPCERSVLVWRQDVRVLHRTLDDDEAQLISLAKKSATLAAVSARLAELGGESPEQRMVELLARWLDAEILARP